MRIPLPRGVRSVARSLLAAAFVSAALTGAACSGRSGATAITPQQVRTAFSAAGIRLGLFLSYPAGKGVLNVILAPANDPNDTPRTEVDVFRTQASAKKFVQLARARAPKTWLFFLHENVLTVWRGPGVTPLARVKLAIAHLPS